MKTTKNKLPLFFNILIIIFEIIGCSMCAKHGLSVLQYYTVLSNIFALITSSLYVAFYLKTKNNIPLALSFLRYASTVCLTLTFAVVLFFFVPLAGFNVMVEGVQIFHHLLCPVLSFISFVFFVIRNPLSKKHIFLSLLPTFTYAAVIIVLNILKVVEGPYPFLMVYQQSVILSVLYFIIISGMALFAATLLRI